MNIFNAFRIDNGYRLSCPHCTLDVDINYGEPIPGAWKFPYHDNIDGGCLGSHIDLGRALVKCPDCHQYVNSPINSWEGKWARLAAHKNCITKGCPIGFERKDVDKKYVG